MIHANLRQLKKRRIVRESKREVIMGRTKQGGSVLSFIIVGIVLLGVLAGGVYLYKHVWAPGAQTQTASKPTSPSESTPPAPNDNSSQSSGGSSGSSNSSSNSSSTPPAQPQPSPAPQSSSQLPTTGPADTLGTMLVLGAITAAASAYMQSRRAVRSL